MKILRWIVRAFGLSGVVRPLKRRMLVRRLVRVYGRPFVESRIGKLTVQGVTFPFRDPGLSYLRRTDQGRSYEPSVTHSLSRLLTDGTPSFLDIGAYTGFFTVFASRVNPDCQIHAFEPSPSYLDLLRDNVRINDSHARVRPLALSDGTGQVTFGDRSFKVDDGDTPVVVEAVPFDELRRTENIRADVVKLDVHGSEGKVLFGMQEALREDVRHLFCELHPQEMLVDYDVRQILDLLVESGLEVFEMDSFRDEPQPRLVPLAERYDELIDPARWSPKQNRDRRMLYATRG